MSITVGDWLSEIGDWKPVAIRNIALEIGDWGLREDLQSPVPHFQFTFPADPQAPAKVSSSQHIRGHLPMVTLSPSE